MSLKKCFLLLIISLIPFLVKAESCDSEGITIESIELEEKSESVIELAEATVENNKIKLNLDITTLGDSAKYKIVIENTSEEDYELDKNLIDSESEYVKYSIEYEEDDEDEGIVLGASKKTIYLVVEYKNEVPDTQFDNGKYNNNDVLMINLSNESKETPIENILSPNPNTNTGKYLIAIGVILIVSIAAFIILRKTKFAKYFVLLISGIIIVPLYVRATCSYDMEIESEVTITQRIICKRATTLKTERCNNWDYHGQCYSVGWYNGGPMNTDIITFGNLGTAGELNTGDAFICDVNGDEEFDVNNERFYYVTDYYDTVENTFDEETAVLIYDANTTNGLRNIPTFNAYSETADVTDGPTEAIKHLPTTEQWSNVQLKSDLRQLRTYNEQTVFNDKELPLYDFSGKAARMITWQEIKRACDMTNSQIDVADTFPFKCHYMYSNLAFSNRSNKAFSHWVDTVYSQSEVLMVYSFSMRVFTIEGNSETTRGIRPVIDVPKKNIQYRQ